MVSDNLFDSLNLDRNKVDLGGDSIVPPTTNTPVATPEVSPIEEEVPQESASPAEEVEAFSAAEGFRHAFKYETLTGFGVRKLTGKEFEPDPDLNLTVSYFEENFSDIPEEFREKLYEGESVEEIKHTAEWIRERLADQKKFDALSVPAQVSLLLGATVADAPTLLASFIAGSVTAGAGSAVTAGRLGVTGTRILKVLGGAAGAGVETAVQEAILSSEDPLKNEQTVILAGLLGFGFGAVGAGVGQKLASSKIKKAAAKDAKELGDHLIREAAAEIAGNKSSTKTYLTTSSTTALDAQSAGAKSTPLDRLYDGVPTSDAGGLRKAAIDLTSQLKRSKSPEFQKFGEILGEDGIYGGGATMALEFDTTSRPILADGLRDINRAYTSWAKDNGVGVAGRIGHKGRQEFNERLSLVVRGVVEPETAAEKEGAKAAQKFFKEMLDVAKSSGVRGFENIGDSVQYLTRQYNPTGFRKVTDKFGDQSQDIITRTLKGAIKAGNNQFDDEVAGLIAKGIYKRTMSTRLPTDEKFTTVLTNNFKDELSNILENAEVDDSQIESILSKLTSKGDNGLDVTKSRIDLDEGFVDLESGLKLTDLLENNTEQLMVRYSRSVGGAAAAAKFGYETPQDLLNSINRSADNAFQSGTLNERQAKAARRKATNLANQILGRANEDFGTAHQIAQLLMDYEYIRTSGGFALASLPEMMVTTAENGFAATMAHVPIGRKFISDIRRGVKPDQELLSVLQSFGVGRDMDMMNAFVRIAEDDALEGIAGKGIQALNAAKRVASVASGLPQLTRFSQVVAGKSTIQKFANMAYSDKPIKLKQWLRQLGFENEEQVNNMFVGLRKHSITQPGLIKGQKVVGLDYEKWMKEDPTAATQFMYAVARRVNHQIQRNLPGETPEFMSKTWGKAVTQFRTFGLAAYGKKTLNALARRDAESAIAIGYTTAFAGMIYAARMYAQAQTMDNPERFLKERLAPDQIVKASIERSGFASILPALIDNGISITKPFHGQDKIFNDFSRTSGLDVGGVDSVPAAGFAKGILKAGDIPRKLATGEPVEEKDVRGLKEILPGNRLPGINFTFEKLINEFPERGREK